MDALADDGVGDICVEDTDAGIVDPIDITIVVAREPPPPAAHAYLLSLGLSSSVTGAEGGVNGEDAEINRSYQDYNCKMVCAASYCQYVRI